MFGLKERPYPAHVLIGFWCDSDNDFFIVDFIIVDVVELRQLVKQLPKPLMLLGDFNGHHTMWGCGDINPRKI